MRRLILTIPILLTFTAGFSQSPRTDSSGVLLHESPGNRKEDNTGPNKKNFSQWTFQMGTVAGQSNPMLKIVPLRSSYYGLAYRYKRKISSVLSLGYEARIRNVSYGLSNSHPQHFIDSVFNERGTIHRKDHLLFGTLNLAGYVRFNIDPRRGNYLGYYIDLGFEPGWTYDGQFSVVDVLANKTVKRTKYSHYPQYNRLEYDAFIRLGFNWLTLEAAYVISPRFKDPSFPDLPKFLVGFGLNFYRH